MRGEKENEDDKNAQSKERDKSIAEWIGRPFKPPSRNEDEGDEDKEEDVGDPLDSIEYRSSGDKDDEGCEDNQEEGGIYNYEDTVVYDAEDNEEEASSWHEDELPSSKSSESSDDKDEEDNRTGAKDINCDGNRGGDMNIGARGGSAEWLRFLSPGREQ